MTKLIERHSGIPGSLLKTNINLISAIREVSKDINANLLIGDSVKIKDKFANTKNNRIMFVLEVNEKTNMVNLLRRI